MAAANVTWGAPRIHGELLKLGFEMSERTVSRLMPKLRKNPSQMWKTFLTNHVGQLAIDFFTVSTLQVKVLFVFVVVAHERRRVLHFNVTDYPTAVWTAQKIIEAFPEDPTRRYLIRDRDGVYGSYFRDRGIQQGLTAARSPWQNPFAERLIGTFVAIPVMWRRSRRSPSAIVPLGLVRNINCFGLLYSSSSVRSRPDLNARAQLARSRLSRPPQHLRPAGTGDESKSHRSL
jgi:transposase InsO family protein